MEDLDEMTKDWIWDRMSETFGFEARLERGDYSFPSSLTLVSFTEDF